MTNTAAFPPEELDRLREELRAYRCALRVVETQLVNLNDFYSERPEANPIEHIKTRLKSVPSIAAKLAQRGLPLTAAAATEHLTDIAGARIICCYAKDIADIAATIAAEPGIEVLREKDYVASPKPSGYRSYHMVVGLAPGGPDGAQRRPVEIQIRTAAMDFWASLEHRVRYKYSGDMPEHLSNELYACAERIHELDERLYLIHDLVDLINE